MIDVYTRWILCVRQNGNHLPCENWANAESANRGACPSSSWHTSGSGVYNGLLGCLIYWVEWKTRNARPAKKSRDDNKPATGRRVKPVQSTTTDTHNNNINTLLIQGSFVEFKSFTQNVFQTSQKVRDIFQLRNVIGAISTIVNKQWEYMIVFATGMRFVQFGEIVKNDAPRFDLIFRIIDVWQTFAMFIVERNIRKVFSAKANVNGIIIACIHNIDSNLFATWVNHICIHWCSTYLRARYVGSVKPGWSESNSEPYDKIWLANRSKSRIRRGNHGTADVLSL